LSEIGIVPAALSRRLAVTTKPGVDSSPLFPEVQMVRPRLLGLAVLLGLTVLPLAGCREAAIRYNARYSAQVSALSQQEMPRALPIPVDGVAASHLKNTWGSAREGHRHQGIDIFAPRNTPVRSATAGIVETKGMRGLGGQVVTISGPGGYRLYYAHLEDFGPQETGDWVEAGEVIGYVGNSGNAAISSTHLHYGIYEPSGKALNPYTFLKGGQPFSMQVEPATLEMQTAQTLAAAK
jgi:peptidoglycan LD-endopeptidase LytH